MATFNLTFWGEITPGHDEARAKERFGKLFGIDDPERLEHFFSGKTITLRRNLERKVAAEYYAKLHKIGLEAELVKVDTGWAVSGAAEKERVEARQRAQQEEQARLKAEQEAAREQARLEAEQDAQRRARTEQLARENAEKQEKKRKAAEEAARRKARREAERKRKSEQAALRKARREEEKRQAAEEAARRKAELEEKKRREAQEAARRREEEKRRAAEAAVKRIAELEEKKRREAEEAARRREEEKREAEEAARRREEEKREAEEEAARRRAELEEKKRREAEEAASLQAQKEAERKRKAEKAAKAKARREEQKRKAEQAAAKRRAEEEEKRRREREKAKQEAAENAAREQARREQDRRQQAAEAEQRRAEREAGQQRKAQQAALQKAREEDQRRLQAEAAEKLAAERRAMEAQAIERAATELAQGTALKSTRGRVKSSLELPRRQSQAVADRQAGAPNLYSLHPFRNTAEVRERPALAAQGRRKAFTVGTLALAVLLILGGLFLSRTPPAIIQGIDAVAVTADSQLLFLAGQQVFLHDRAGIGTSVTNLESLDLAVAQPPLAFTGDGALITLARGRASDTGEMPLQLLRCELEPPGCLPVAETTETRTIASLAIHPLTGELFLADREEGRLLKLDASGEALARADLAMPPHPVLRLESGLLFMNSPHGPAISVFRYEDEAFGKQLDEILLLPPPAVAAEQSSVWDFLWAGGNWWVVLYNPGNRDAGLYRFDSQWNYLDQVTLVPGSWPGQLTNWAGKILVSDDRSLVVQRFNAEGIAEVAVESDLLLEQVAGQRHSRSVSGRAWRATLALFAVTAIVGLAVGCLLHWRNLVYRSRPARGAEPIDDLAADARWIEVEANRDSQLKRSTVVYCILALALLLVGIGLGISVLQLTALLIALAGPLLALVILRRNPLGYIGAQGEQLVLVDHHSMYHAGSGSRLQYRGPFLLIDDVVVFCGSAALPAFSREQVHNEVVPRARAGIRVDRKTVLIKLLQSRHPLAQGGLLVLALLGLALAITAVPLLLRGL